MTASRPVKAPYRHPFFRLLNLAVRLAPFRSKGFQNNLLFRKDLHTGEKVVSDQGQIPGVLFDRLTMSDADQLSRYQDALPADDYRRRLEGGHTGFCARTGRDIAGYNWAARDRACHRFGSPGQIVTFPLEKDTAFIYDFFVFRPFRGQGIGIFIKRGIFDQLKRDGFRYVLFCIDHWNSGAIKLALRMNCKPYGLEHVYRVGMGQKWFLGTRAEARRLESWCRQFEEE